MSNTEIMDLFMTVARKIKRPIGNTPPPPKMAINERGFNNGNLPPPPPPPLGCGRILVKLSEYEGLTTTELANILGIRNPSVSEAIKRLDDKGLIERKSSNTDRRSQKLYLTKLGQSSVDLHKKESKKFSETFLSPLEEKEKESLYKILKKLLQEQD